MKMFKKLMAVALAGVMALTVLTGCAATVNKKEMINIMNDFNKLSEADLTYENGDDALAKSVLKNVKTYAENHSNGEFYTDVQAACDALDDIDSDDPANIIDSIVPKDTKDLYTLMWTTMDEYQSKAFKNNEGFVNLFKASMRNKVELNEVDKDKLGNTATVSIATQKIGDTTFLVIVTVQAAK